LTSGKTLILHNIPIVYVIVGRVLDDKIGTLYASKMISSARKM
jgi:hypothetical protein